MIILPLKYLVNIHRANLELKLTIIHTILKYPLNATLSIQIRFIERWREIEIQRERYIEGDTNIAVRQRDRAVLYFYLINPKHLRIVSKMTTKVKYHSQERKQITRIISKKRRKTRRLKKRQKR